MTGASRRQRIQALFFAAIMVVSMVAAGVGGLAGSAAAQENFVELQSEDLKDVYPNEAFDLGADDESDELENHTTPVGISISEYDGNVSVEVDVTSQSQGGEGIQLWAYAKDDETWYDIAQTGGWGPNDGFEATNSTTEVYPAGDAGVYQVNITVSDEESDHKVKESINVAVGLDDATSDPELVESKGNKLEVADGTYNESVTVDVDSLTLEGAGASATTIDAGGSNGAILIEADEVTIQGFHVEGFTELGIADTSDYMDNTVYIKDNEVTGPVADDVGDATVQGIQISGGNGSKVVNNTVEMIPEFEGDEWSSTGILPEGTDNAEIRGNTVDVSDFGIAISTFYDDATGNTIEGNDVTSTNSTGISVQSNVLSSESEPGDNSASDTEIIDNTVDDSSTGLSLIDYGGGGISETDVSDNDFENNAVHLDDPDDFVDLDDILNDQGNTFDRAVTVENDTGTLQTGIFGSVHLAVNNAQDGDTVQVRRGQYEENVSVNTPNLTISGQGDETVINGLVKLNSQGTTLTDVAVDPDEFVRPAVGDGGIPNNDNQGILVGESNITVSNTSVNVSLDANGEFEEINAIQIFSADNITGVDITDNDIVGTARNASSAGIAGISDQGETEGTYIHNNTIDVHGGYSFGVVTRASGGKNVRDTPQSIVVGNSIEATAEVSIAGIGYSIESTDEMQVEATEQVVKGNNFNVGSIQHKATSGTLDLSGNYWENISNVEFISSGSEEGVFNYELQDGGNIIYDPVLTEAAGDIESEEQINQIRQYGSVLDVRTDGEALAIGFSAPSNESLSGLFGTVQFDDPAQAYRYDIDDGFVEVSGNYTPSTGEVVVIATESIIDDRITVPIAVKETDTKSPTTVALNGGWNLVPTGAAATETADGNQVPDVVVSEGTILESKQDLQAQPAQSGAPPADYEAFDGTWVFVERDIANGEIELLTGHETGQSAEDYSQDVLDSDEESET